MKFKNITKSYFHAYGYDFYPGIAVEVTEDNLVRKFGLYHQLEADNGLQEQKTDEEVTDAPATSLTRDELKAKADAMGIEYAPKIRTATLRELVS